MLLILDLDETLIYSTRIKLERSEDFMCEQYYVYKRPHLEEFIERIRAHFEIAVWTASSEIYANTVINNIFPNEYPLAFKWASERCTIRFDPVLHDYVSLKDLKKVKRKGYRIEQILVIDDTPQKISRNYGNYIRIEPFEGNLEDQELLFIFDYLKTFEGVKDVRTFEKRGWRAKRSYA
jgi:Dullard-like phosphatase family protein